MTTTLRLEASVDLCYDGFMSQRKCMLCRGRALEIEESNDITQYINEDGTFMICTYSDAWEICKEVGDPDKLPANTSFLIKNEEYVGRLRGLN